jgi:hypothetical protein
MMGMVEISPRKLALRTPRLDDFSASNEANVRAKIVKPTPAEVIFYI